MLMRIVEAAAARFDRRPEYRASIEARRELRETKAQAIDSSVWRECKGSRSLVFVSVGEGESVDRAEVRCPECQRTWPTRAPSTWCGRRWREDVPEHSEPKNPAYEGFMRALDL